MYARKKAPVSIFNDPRKKKVFKAKPAPSKQKASTAAESQPPAEAERYQDFDIVIKKSDLDQNLRYHALKFQTKNQALVNPYDQSQFERPLSLHRRFAQDKAEVVEPPPVKEEDDKTVEMMSARRAERIAEREQNQKLIAPTGGAESNKPANRKKPQKKVEEGYDDTNPKAQKRQQLRYEESRPWHLEDAEGKNIWVGSYERPLSEQNVMFVFDGPRFNMIPVDKWYKFIETNKVNIVPSEEVERQMVKKFRTPRWALNTHLAQDLQRQEAHRQRAERAQAMKREQQDDDELFGGGDDNGEYQADKDGLDVEYADLNDFQDDDEGELYMDAEGEDGKEIERRLREEMRGAGLGGTGVKDEDIDPEEEYRREQQARLDEYRKSKKMRKRLMKREHKLEYESDLEDEYKYGSSSDSEEDVTEDEEREKGDEEKRKKRPSSPDNLSGNESSRKKLKSVTGRAIGRDIPKIIGGTPPKSETSRTNSRANSRAASPTRAASPARGNSPMRINSPARAGSPAPAGFPTLAEIRAAIPPAGIEIKSLVTAFRGRVGKTQNKQFIAIVKVAGTQDKASGLIMPKEQAAGSGA